MLSDQCHRLLHVLGWSTGETAFRQPDGAGYWQVDAGRDGQIVLATAATQGVAWALAVRMVGSGIRIKLTDGGWAPPGGGEGGTPEPGPMACGMGMKRGHY
jgi:hypothetical protein